MGKLVVTGFKPEHLDKYVPRTHDVLVPTLRKHIEQTIRESYHMAIIEEDTGRLVAGGGLLVQWPHVAECWMIGSELVAPYKKSLCKYVRNFLVTGMEQLDLNRLQATVLATEPRFAAFAMYLDFVYEGYMPKYGPEGEDHLRFGRIR